MAFVESESGAILNTNHISRLHQTPAGYYTVRWSDGMVQNLNGSDGDALKAAMLPAAASSLPLAGSTPGWVTKEDQPKAKPKRGRPRKESKAD